MTDEAPATQPDLDALIGRADRQIAKWQDRRTERGPATIEVMRNLRDALAAERARADQAERNVKRYQDRARENRKLLDQYAGQLAKIPHTEDCLIGEWNEAAGHSMPCTCWKSVAPTTNP